MRAAIIIPVHNRREVTLRCLRSLHAPRLPADFAVIVVDDGSTDGTAAAIAAEFPGVMIEAGDGQLYWTGGIVQGMKRALIEGAQFLFWLNDDCLPEAGALQRMLRHLEENPRTICGASCFVKGESEPVQTGFVQRRRLNTNGGVTEVARLERILRRHAGDCRSGHRPSGRSPPSPLRGGRHLHAASSPERLPHCVAGRRTGHNSRRESDAEPSGSRACFEADIPGIHPADVSRTEIAIFLERPVLVPQIQIWISSGRPPLSCENVSLGMDDHILVAPSRRREMKPRLLIVGTAYAIPEHRKKLDFLANHFELTCATAQKSHGFGWTETVGTGAAERFRLVGLPLGGALEAGTRCWYRGLSAVFREGRYDIILVESEPWAVLRWQCWLLKIRFQRRAKFGEFTWENILRGGWKGPVLGLIYRMAARTSDFIVGGNQGAVELMRLAGASPAAACVTQFGVDTGTFSPLSEPEKRRARRAAGLPEDAFVIAFCGRLVAAKGVRDLLEAFQQLQSAGKELRLVIMGSGELENEFRNASRSNPKIQLIPPRKHSEVGGLLQITDVLVLPSRTSAGPSEWWKEQFGHILIEAMACGAAAIGSDCGAIPEVLQDRAVVFPEGNADALRSLLQSLIQDPQRLAEIRASQRERVLAEYTQPAVAAKWAQIFARQLG